MSDRNIFFNHTTPLSDVDLAFIQESRQTISSILAGEDPRLILLVGPCSVHDMQATLDYSRRLASLAESVNDRFFCVMRCYVEKPRTTLGWKGMLYDPHLDGSYEMMHGIGQTQQLFSTLTSLRLPIGCEILELTTSPFYTDYLSWGCIGARTSASPPHRQIASGLPFPIGFKNSIDGNIDVAIDGLITAREQHIFLGPNSHGTLEKVQTPGNPNCHVVLRGSAGRPNYYPKDIERVVKKARQSGVLDRLMVDCSHDNSQKQHDRQPEIFEDVIEQAKEGCHEIAGIMLESFIEEGSQPLTKNLRYGVSITDGCLSWDQTKALIVNAYKALTPTSVSFCLC